MKALCYNGPRDVRYESMADAQLEDDRDVLVRMDACSICGSDLHMYHGLPLGKATHFCIGHEAIGEVVETGSAVRRLKSGDRVMLSGAVGCGACVHCLSGQIARCENGGMRIYGLGRGLQGCQAEAIRVPVGDFNAAPIPDGVTAEQALLLTDSLSTAWFGCRNADIHPGDTVVVIGLGPIGLMVVECALVLGASRVFAVDPIVERRAIATQLGATALAPDTALEQIREATGGRMARSAVEAVGADATVRLALDVVGRQGTVSVIGVNKAKSFDFPIGELLPRGLTFRIGVCSVQCDWPELVPLLQQGRLRPERFITHTLPLSAGSEAYRLFDERRDGVLKTVLRP